jgi:hypothetical protein
MSTDTSGTRLVWGLVSFFGLVAIAYFGWLGSNVVDMKADVAELKAQMRMVLHVKRDETADTYRGAQ